MDNAVLLSQSEDEGRALALHYDGIDIEVLPAYRLWNYCVDFGLFMNRQRWVWECPIMLCRTPNSGSPNR